MKKSKNRLTVSSSLFWNKFSPENFRPKSGVKSNFLLEIWKNKSGDWRRNWFVKFWRAFLSNAIPCLCILAGTVNFDLNPTPSKFLDLTQKPFSNSGPKIINISSNLQNWENLKAHCRTINGFRIGLLLIFK